MQSVRSNGSLPVALLMMMVGEDIVFCANVMVLQLGFILSSCVGLVVAGLIMCEHHQLVLYKKVLYKIQKMCTTLVTTRPTLVLFLWTPYMRFFLLSGQRFWVAVLTLQCMCTLKGGFASRDLPVVWNGLTFGRSGRWWLLTLCVFCKKKKPHIMSVKEDACHCGCVLKKLKKICTINAYVQRQKKKASVSCRLMKLVTNWNFSIRKLC